MASSGMVALAPHNLRSGSSSRRNKRTNEDSGEAPAAFKRRAALSNVTNVAPQQLPIGVKTMPMAMVQPDLRAFAHAVQLPPATLAASSAAMPAEPTAPTVCSNVFSQPDLDLAPFLLGFDRSAASATDAGQPCPEKEQQMQQQMQPAVDMAIDMAPPQPQQLAGGSAAADSKIRDIHQDDRLNPCAAVEYADEIYAYLRTAEARDRPPHTFVEQKEKRKRRRN